MDCHLAYSVTNVEFVKTATTGFTVPSQCADASCLVVTLRTRFDETTIGPQRGNGLLNPNPRTIHVVDEQGRISRPVAMSGAELMRPLRPGESYETRILFAMADDARNPRMLVSDPGLENSFLIGHENSPLHRKAYFDVRD
jgi:hypothetical protein